MISSDTAGVAAALDEDGCSVDVDGKWLLPEVLASAGAEEVFAFCGDDVTAAGDEEADSVGV